MKTAGTNFIFEHEIFESKLVVVKFKIRSENRLDKQLRQSWFFDEWTVWSELSNISVDKVHQIISMFVKRGTLKYVGQNLCWTVNVKINLHMQTKCKDYVFLNEVWLSSSQLSLWHDASQCVTGGSSQFKIIFGSGTRLNIEPSEYW